MIHEIPQSNYEVGRRGYKPEAIVIHIQQGTQEGTISWFKNPISGVSSHLAISKKGITDEFVSYLNTAYHAGRVNQPIWAGIKKNLWGGYINPNFYIIGIECEGFRGERWTDAQMANLVQEIRAICELFEIPKTRARIISHHEIAADKENMSEWCDEVVKRLNIPNPPKVDKKAELVACLTKILDLAKQL